MNTKTTDRILELTTRIADLAQQNAENYTQLGQARRYVECAVKGSNSTYIDAKPLFYILGLCRYADSLEELAAETEADE